MSRPPVRRVSAAELRELFAAGDYLRRVATGELSTRVRRSDHPSPERSGQPRCTKSQIIEYLDGEGQRVALVHQYLRPNGSIGGSGRPDPKVLLIDGVFLTVFASESD